MEFTYDAWYPYQYDNGIVEFTYDAWYPKFEPTLEDLIRQMATNTLQFQQETEASLQNLGTQIGQLACTVNELMSKQQDEKVMEAAKHVMEENHVIQASIVEEVVHDHLEELYLEFPEFAEFDHSIPLHTCTGSNLCSICVEINACLHDDSDNAGNADCVDHDDGTFISSKKSECSGLITTDMHKPNFTKLQVTEMTSTTKMLPSIEQSPTLEYKFLVITSRDAIVHVDMTLVQQQSFRKLFLEPLDSQALIELISLLNDIVSNTSLTEDIPPKPPPCFASFTSTDFYNLVDAGKQVEKFLPEPSNMLLVYTTVPQDYELPANAQLPPDPGGEAPRDVDLKL